MSFAERLTKALEGASKVVVVGMGNELNGDDGFGVHVARALGNYRNIISIQAHTVPENFISKIASEKPSHVIFIDTAVLDAPPGTLELLEAQDLARVKILTHRMPLPKLIERLKETHKANVLIVAMQPKGMEVGAPLSAEASSAAGELISLFRKTSHNCSFAVC